MDVCNTETRVWKEVHCQGPSPGVRENNGVVEYKGSLYLFGGYNGSQWLNDFHGFHIGEAFWFLQNLAVSGGAVALHAAFESCEPAG